MKPFFTDNDFEGDIEITLGHTMGPMLGHKETVEKVSKSLTIDKAVELANAKLEREGVVVYGHELDSRLWKTERSRYSKNNGMVMTPEPYKALLICVEPIQPLEPCKHPPEKIKQYTTPYGSFLMCECGVPVKQVVSYEEEK